MNDSQPRKRSSAAFEVPDLEIERALRPFAKQVPTSPAQGSPSAPRDADAHGLSTFDEDSFSVGNSGSIELDLEALPRQNEALFGGAQLFEDHPSVAPKAVDVQASVEPARFAVDPAQAIALAAYGPVPHAIQLAPLYAFRVFVRKRQLERELITMSSECERAERAREAALAEIARAVVGSTDSNASSALAERARSASEQAEQLIRGRELQRRAIGTYDHERVSQGVRLACTVTGAIVFLLALKLVS